MLQYCPQCNMQVTAFKPISFHNDQNGRNQKRWHEHKLKNIRNCKKMSHTKGQPFVNINIVFYSGQVAASDDSDWLTVAKNLCKAWT